LNYAAIVGYYSIYEIV